MATATHQQQRLDLGPSVQWREERSAGHLLQPFTKEEQRRIQRLYVEHRGLIRTFGAKLGRKYRHCLDRETVYSCIDFAFMKACRVHDPSKGKLSTILGVYAEGEIKHYLRDHNWGVKAPGEVRTRGQAARRLLETGMIMSAVARSLNCTPQQVKEALVATCGLAHDIKGFDLHACPRPTPWDLLIEQET